MRRFLTHLLMLVMLMPGLACGPFMTSGKAQAAPVSMPDMQDCPGMGMEKKDEGKTHDGPTFFKDCAHSDLQKADTTVVLKKADLSGDNLTLAFADIVQPAISPAGDMKEIRGPPPEWPGFSETQPSILLTTQRFRE